MKIYLITQLNILKNVLEEDKNKHNLCIDAKIGNENIVKIICDYIKNK